MELIKLMFTKQNRKYLIIASVILALLIIVSVYLSRGWIFINTNSDDSEIVISSDGGTKQIIKGRSIFINLPPGDYSIMARNSSGATSKFVGLFNGQIAVVSLNITKANEETFVAHQLAYNLKVNDKRLVYLDENPTDGIREITVSGEYNPIGLYANISSIYWLNANYGVMIYAPIGEGLGSDLMIGVFDDGKLETIRPPQKIVGQNSIVVSPNKDLYMSIGSKIYRKLSNESVFSSVYNSDRDIILLSSNDGLVFLEVNNDSDEDYDSPGATLTVLDKSMNKVSSLNVNYSTGVPFKPLIKESKDGKNIAVLINGQLSIYSRNLKNKTILSRTSTITGVDWVSDDQLVYSVGNYIWDYNIKNQESKALGILSSDSTVSDMILSDDGKEVYFMAKVKDNSDAIYKINLVKHNRTNSELVNKLSSALPYSITLPNCDASLINFNQPFILLDKRFDGSIEETKSNTDWCTELIDDYLKNKVGISNSSNIPKVINIIPTDEY